MNEYYFNLNLSYEKCMDYYHGRFSFIQVTTDGGKTIRFAAHYLRPYVSQVGIKSRFRMTLTNTNKFVKLERVV